MREMLAYAAARIMEVEVELRTGAANGTRSPLREVQRIGYREWDRDVLVGSDRYEQIKGYPMGGALSEPALGNLSAHETFKNVDKYSIS